jgi:hypothetical protein
MAIIDINIPIEDAVTDGSLNPVTSNAVFDALALKVNTSDLPSNLTLYPTTTASDIGGYFLLVTTLSDPDYDNPAVDVSTGSITGVGQLISSLATVNGQLTGNPGEINISTVGNIKRTAGSGSAQFYYEVYHRTSGGVETLVATSDLTTLVSSNTYVEFNASAILNNGTWATTDRIVMKFYGSKIGGGSNPTFNFQFGGLTPVRTIMPVPASVIVDLPITIDSTSINNGTANTLLRNEGGKVGDTNYTVPKTDGTANQVLQTNGAGVVTWQTLATGITIGTTAITSGTDGRVLFQNGGVVQQDSLFVFNPTTKAFGIGVSAPNGILNAVGGVSELRFSTGAGSATPTLAVINTGGTGKAAALAAGTGGSVFAYDNAGFFGIVGESKATILSNSVGSGTIHFRIEANGNVGVGAAASARLDVRAQGALSTDITVRARNSSDTANLFELRGNTTFDFPTYLGGYVGGLGSEVRMGNAGTFYTQANQFVVTGSSVVTATNGAFIQDSVGQNVLFNSRFVGTSQISLNMGRANIHLGGLTGDAHTGHNILGIANGTAPSASYTDRFMLYSADIAAGNAAPHFRTENGGIIKLYQQATGGAASTFVSNTSLIANDTATFDGYTIGQVVKALRNLGILA